MVLLTIVSCGVWANESIATVGSDWVEPSTNIGTAYKAEVSMVTLPVYHDTTGRTEASLTEREKHFLSQVPEVVGSKTGKTLRDACREMILGLVIHVPALPCGNWTPNDSKRYWGIYQSWTGPAKVTVPVIKGDKGDQGDRGSRGAKGDKGDKGDAGQGTVINNYSFGSSVMMAGQIGGNYAPMVVSTQLGGVSYVRSMNISICNTANAPTNITNNNSNANTNVNANNNAINVGDGSASGSASGSGNSGATSGN
jgi:hypothetical protein